MTNQPRKIYAHLDADTEVIIIDDVTDRYEICRIPCGEELALFLTTAGTDDMPDRFDDEYIAKLVGVQIGTMLNLIYGAELSVNTGELYE